MAQLGIIAEVQPYHAIDDMRWMEERIGERARWAYAFRTLHDAGVLLSSADWPGTNASWYPANPLHRDLRRGHPADARRRPEGGWFPEERIDVETALRAYTVNNAWAAGEEHVKGQLAPGMLADFAVLERDRCSGFYFTGGVQSRILDAFRPGGQTTPAYQALLQRWQEGAVVAGSSAGAAMMSDPMIAGGSSAGAIAAGIRTAAAADRDDEGDASGGGVSIAPGMGLFQGGIVDQHFLARGRIGRLLVAVLGLDEFHHGFGIDENTALLADGSRVSVAGASAVVIVDASQAQRTGRGGTGIRLHLMSAGDSYDLNTRRLLIAADKAPLPVRDGTATATTTAHPDIFARWALLHLLHEFAGSSRAELVAPVEGGKLVLRKNAEFAARSRSGTGVEGTPEALTITGITVDLHLAEQRR
jgi:cyanophycinase